MYSEPVCDIQRMTREEMAASSGGDLTENLQKTWAWTYDRNQCMAFLMTVAIRLSLTLTIPQRW